MDDNDAQHTIDANVTGSVSGQVAVGDYILQIGSISGGVVQVQAPGLVPVPRPVASPVRLRPRQFPGFVDRERETEAVVAALRAGQSVEVCGEAGIGKAVFLRRLAYDPESEAFPDGVAYLSARHQPGRDVLQSLFEAFYECDEPYRPTDVQIQRALQEKRALVLIDSPDADAEAVESLLNAAPCSTFVLALRERALWGEGCNLTLRGLPMDAALRVMEQELGRSLDAAERPSAESLCESVGCNPLRIVQAAARAREDERAIADLAREAAQAPPAKLSAQMVESLPSEQRNVILALAALGRASAHPEHIAAVAQSADISADLDSLSRRRLVDIHSGKVALASELADDIAQRPETEHLRDRALEHYTEWSESEGGRPEAIAQEADAIASVADYASRARRWGTLMRLVRAVEGALSLANMWRAWGMVMERGLLAARAVKDEAFEAWALHQIGTHALCVGDTLTAKDMLTRALEIRVSLRDEPGVQATLSNLRLLGPVQMPPSSIEHPRAGPPRRPAFTYIALAALVIGGLLILLSLALPKPQARPTRLAMLPPAILESGRSRGKITLDRRVTGSDMLFEVTATPPGVLDVPGAAVVIPVGEVAAAFDVSAKSGADPVRVTITAACANGSVATTLYVAGRSVADLRAVSVGRVKAGRSTTGIVTLTGPAPKAGATVDLSSSDANAAKMPRSVTVPGGERQAAFSITAAAVHRTTTVRVTASYRGVSTEDTLTIEPLADEPASAVRLADLVLESDQIQSGQSVSGHVRLSGKAPHSLSVSIRQEGGRDRVDVPNSVSIAQGQTAKSFVVRSRETDKPLRVRVCARLNDEEKARSLVLLPAVPARTSDLSAVSVPDRVTAGEEATGTVVLTEPAPKNGAVIDLSSSNAGAVDMRGNVVVPEGKTQATFGISTRAVRDRVAVRIVGSYRHRSRAGTLTLEPKGPPEAPPPFRVRSVRVIRVFPYTLGRTSGRSEQTLYGGLPETTIPVEADRPLIAVEAVFSGEPDMRTVVLGESVIVTGARGQSVSGRISSPSASAIRWESRNALPPGIYAITLEAGPGGIRSTRRQGLSRALRFRISVSSQNTGRGPLRIMPERPIRRPR